MALGDFADLYGLAARAAQRDITLAADATRAKEAVNDIYMQVCDSGDNWDFLQAQGTQAMVVGQESYTYTTIGTSLGVTVTHVLGLGQPVAGASFHYLAWDDYWAIKALDPGLANGTPHIWMTTADGTLHVWPKPNAVTAITVLVQRQATELVADGDVPLIPLQLRRRLIVPGAAAVLLRQDGGTEALQAATLLDAEFEQALKELREAHAIAGPLPRPEEGPVQLPTGLLGAAGTFADLARKACYSAGLRPWMSYDVNRAKDAVNAAYLATLGSGDQWDFLEREGQWTTVAGSDIYTITSIGAAIGAASLVEVLYLTNDTDGTPTLVAMPWQELESLASSTQEAGESRGTPVVWSKWGDRIRLWPTPDAVYKIGTFGRLSGTRLSADSDAPLIPIDFREEVLVAGAAARLLRQPRQGEDNAARAVLADRYEAEYEQAVRAMRTAHAASRAPTLMAVGVELGDVSPGPYPWGWFE